MEWKKKNNFSTIKEVVLNNLNISEKEYNEWFSKEYKIKNLDLVAEKIKSYNKNDLITIVGDYDVDGTTSTAIITRVLKTLGYNVKYRIPKRKSEGYGLNPLIIDEITTGMIITIDNGISAIEAINKAKEKGLYVIVIDHHQKGATLPNADIIVDPHIEDDSTFKNYCAGGLAYKLIQMLTDDENLINTSLSLAALATVADSMPLIEENYIIVKKGLKTLVSKTGRNCGLYSLLEANDCQNIVTEKDIGYKIAPCINAPGRLYDDGGKIVTAQLLWDGNLKVSEKTANLILDINEKRKVLKETGLNNIKRNIYENNLQDNFPLIIYEPNIDEGVVGIIAGKLAEDFKKPVIVFTDSEDLSVLKGSGRSYGDFDIFKFLNAHADEFTSLGGHPAACGLSILRENFNHCQNLLTTIKKSNDKDNVLYYDLEIDLEKDNIDEIYKELMNYAPYGVKNSNIIFHIKNFKCVGKKTNEYYLQVGNKKQHIKFLNPKIDGIAFDSTEKYLAMGTPKNLELIGTLSLNHFNDYKKIQIEVIDFKKIEKQDFKTELQKLLYSV